MSALFSAIAAVMFLVFSCGQDDSPNQSNLSMTNSKGRLTCAGFSNVSDHHERISGCTGSNRLSASSDNYSMEVLRRGDGLSISLRNQKTGDIWDGVATLKYPIGGTGTRARVLVQQPMLAMMSCELDTLLGCRPQ